MSIAGGVLRLQTTIHTPAKRRLAGRVRVIVSGWKNRVAIFKRGTLEYVASGMSNTDGTWEIKGLPELPEEQLMVFYIDDTRAFNPIAFDYVSEEV